MKLCGNKSSKGHVCALKKRHSPRAHQFLAPDGKLASWVWLGLTCHVREVDLQQVDAALIAAREPLQHVAHYVRQFDRKPLKKQADEFYGIHSGTEFEASLKMSVLRKAVKAFELHEALL